MPVSSTKRPASRAKTTRAAAKSKPAAKKLPGISRIDHGRTHGWFIRLGWRSTKKGTRPKFVSFFGDFSYGGKAKALAAAEKWVRFVIRHGRAPAEKS